jgi:hypothetical protein
VLIITGASQHAYMEVKSTGHFQDIQSCNNGRSSFVHILYIGVTLPPADK